jgi:hypothetical protein
MIMTDDCDLSITYLDAYFGGNGDVYISVISEDGKGLKTPHTVRIATSGGNARTEVKIAAAELCRALVNTQNEKL